MYFVLVSFNASGRNLSLPGKYFGSIYEDP